jgi:hypothetical protein
MKTREEIIAEYLQNAQETLQKIALNEEFLQERYATDSNKRVLDEMTRLASDKKDTEAWIAFLTRKSTGNT